MSTSVIHPALTHSVPASKTFQSSCLLFHRKQTSTQNSCWPSNFGEQQKPCDGVLSQSTDFTPLGDTVLSYRCSLVKRPCLTEEGGKNEYLPSWLTLLSCGPVTWLFSVEGEWSGGSPDPVLSQASAPIRQKTYSPETSDSFGYWNALSNWSSRTQNW